MDKQKVEQRAHELENAINTLRRTNFTTKDDSGLRHSEKHFLFLIATLNNGQPVIPSEAAKKIGVTLAAVTHYINSLEKRGYVVRSPSADDRRVVFVSLSDKGAEMVDNLRKNHFQKMCGLIEFIGDEDSAELIALMTKIAEYIKKTSNT